MERGSPAPRRTQRRLRRRSPNRRRPRGRPRPPALRRRGRQRSRAHRRTRSLDRPAAPAEPGTGGSHVRRSVAPARVTVRACPAGTRRIPCRSVASGSGEAPSSHSATRSASGSTRTPGSARSARRSVEATTDCPTRAWKSGTWPVGSRSSVSSPLAGSHDALHGDAPVSPASTRCSPAVRAPSPTTTSKRPARGSQRTSQPSIASPAAVIA